MKFLSIFLAFLCLFAAASALADRLQVRVSDPQDTVVALEFLINSHHKIQIHTQKTQTDMFSDTNFEPFVYSNAEDPALADLIKKTWQQSIDGDTKVFEFDLSPGVHRLRILGKTSKTKFIKRTGELFNTSIDASYIFSVSHLDTLAILPGSGLEPSRNVVIRKLGNCKKTLSGIN